MAIANIETAPLDPDKLWPNGLGESFSGRCRNDCLSMRWFRNRTDAKIVMESWRRHYNEVRPRSRLGSLAPAEFER